MMKKYLLKTVFALTCFFSVGVVNAQQYPEKPITFIVSYGPGGGTDLVARMIAPFIEKYLGNSARIIVVNKPGAGGAIGFSELARAPADGYTIGFLNTPNMLTIPIERKSTFSWESYDLLANLIDDPDSFAVIKGSPFTNLKELTEYAKANPGKVTVGTTGVGSDDHLAMLMFEKATGTKLAHVPYKGAAEVRGAVASGQIMMAAMNVGEVLQYTKGCTPLVMLGQMANKRSVLAPNIPTFAEQGIKIEMASLRGLGAPKGLPPAINEKLVKAINQAANDPEYIKKAADMFAPVRFLPPKAYGAELKSTEAMFKQLWKDMPWND